MIDISTLKNVEFLTLGQAAKLTGSKRTAVLRQAIKRDELRAFKVGSRSIIILKEDMMKWLLTKQVSSGKSVPIPSKKGKKNAK